MNKIDVIGGAMMEVMKAKDKVRKDPFSTLLSTLKNVEIDRCSPLTEEEENAIVKKEIKRCQETFDTAPADQEDIKEEVVSWAVVYKEFAPEDMSVEQIKEVIAGVLAELGIETSTSADKSRIIKVSILKVRGKADGKVVNETLTAMSR